MYEYDNPEIKKKDDNILRFIYHGNSKHIGYFRKKLEFVLNNIQTNKKKELHLIYDLKNKKIKIGDNCKEIAIYHHKHSHEKIEEILSKGGIGLVPQLIPENRSLFHHSVTKCHIVQYEPTAVPYQISLEESKQV